MSAGLTGLLELLYRPTATRLTKVRCNSGSRTFLF